MKEVPSLRRYLNVHSSSEGVAEEPERLLALSVLAQAVKDACGQISVVSGSTGNPKARPQGKARLQTQAQAWLTSPYEGVYSCRWWCDAAGLRDPGGAYGQRTLPRYAHARHRQSQTSHLAVGGR